MGAILSTSFIFASGLAKTVGKWLQLQMNITDWWMPFAAGAIFSVPLLIGVYLLSKTPAPSADDVAHRTIRKPMTREERSQFIKIFGFTLVPVDLHYKGGRVKAEIALAKGKAEHDKRDTEKKRDWDREKGRLMRHKVSSKA
jgi:SsrA-binding protein